MSIYIFEDPPEPSIDDDFTDHVLIDVRCPRGAAYWAPPIVVAQVNRKLRKPLSLFTEFIIPRFGVEDGLWDVVHEEREIIKASNLFKQFKRTQTFEGTKLRVWVIEPQYGGRPPERVLLESEEQMIQFINNLPHTRPDVMLRVVANLCEQIVEPYSDEDEQNALHSIWEIVTNQSQHANFPEEAMQAIVQASLNLHENPPETVSFAASIIWSLAATTRCAPDPLQTPSRPPIDPLWCWFLTATT
eukprot:8451164-Pyramimonas_sp.AAC.1